MTGSEIRQKYLDFFAARGHAIIPSAPILPENDPSTLFTSSGMQPLVPYLMGEPHPAGKRLVDSQKSFRAGDIEEVGDNRHNTFFEMLGNWSLGDYFKQEQLPWFFEFLTAELKIDPQRLYVSVFRGNPEIGVARDDVSVAAWQKIFAGAGIEAAAVDFAERDGMQGGRIFYYDEQKNWWSRSGAPANMPIGEIGGPDSEVFYDLGADLKRHEHSAWKDKPCHINCDCGRFIEIGNSVFIEFQKTADGFVPLKQQNVDFGGGLERITMVVQGTDNVFETDLFRNIINRISQLSGGKEYRENMKAFEVIADHLKAAAVIMGDDRGVSPSNVDQGYVVRRLIRRAIRYGRLLGIEGESWTKEVAKVAVHDYYRAYPELKRNVDFIVDNCKQEEAKFRATLDRGLKVFEQIAVKKTVGNIIVGEEAFDLFQSYGFPLEMTVELAAERGLTVDQEGFRTASERHQELSRTATAGKFRGGLADHSEDITRLHTATHLLLGALRQVLGEHVFQKGSNITSERLRFDFNHGAKMTVEQIARVESIVNDAIAAKMPVTCREMDRTEAAAFGAVGIFESKYGDKVKVYLIGDPLSPYSKELCGGPHVENTGSLGLFKIQKEEASSAGVRRIKAILQ